MKVLHETLFWFHALFIFGALILGLFIPPLAVVLLIALHELQIILFGGCILSKAQVFAGGIQNDQDFIQVLCNRLLGISIKHTTVRSVDITLKFSMLLISVIGRAGFG